MDRVQSSPSVFVVIGLFQIALIILKLLGLITASWLRVFIPTFALLIVVAVLFMLLGIWFFTLIMSVEIKTKDDKENK